jgi:hypothetical protein
MAEQLHANDSLTGFKLAMNSSGHLQLRLYPVSSLGSVKLTKEQAYSLCIGCNYD